MEESPEPSVPQAKDKGTPITLFWEDLTFRVPIKNKAVLKEQNQFKVVMKDDMPMRTVVENLTGVARPNEIIGLLGPSSGGKTVLMSMFSDRIKAPPGSEYSRNVYVNNKVPLTRKLFGLIGAYVMQDDVLLETLSPYECLKFSANLRLSCSQEEKESRVQKIIQDLRLEKCKHTLVN